MDAAIPSACLRGLIEPPIQWWATRASRWGAAKNAYHGTATALDDTRITTAVKTDLAAAKDLRSGQIHVTTVAAVVTLRGTVHDSAVATRAETIARNASGVRGVKNHLKVSSSVPKD